MNINQVKKLMPLQKFLRLQGRQVLNAGAVNFKVCCLFHQERTASCHIYTKSKKYHCFGCGAHGDIITMVIEMELADSPTSALRYLERLIVSSR